MNNEEPPGGTAAVVESPTAIGATTGPEQPSVTPTTENVLDQVGQVAANAEAAGGPLPTSTPPGETPVIPTTENALDQANADVAGAEVSEGALPANGEQAPTAENTSSLNPANPFGTPGTDALNATHQEMVQGKEAAKNEQNKGGFLSKLKNWSPIKAKTESVASTPAAPVEGGVGIMPGSVQTETPLPPGANQNLAGGTTPPVPNVSVEANAAANAQTEQTQATDMNASIEPAPTAPPTTPAEGMGNDVNGKPITEAHLAEASTGPSMPSPEAVSSAPSMDAHPEIAQFDKDKAAEGGAQDEAQNAANMQDAEQPDLLKVTPDAAAPTVSEVDVSGATPAEIPTGLPDAPRSDVSESHIDGTSTHPDAPVVGQESILPTAVDAVKEPGDTPLETQANELDKKDEDQSEKWTTPQPTEDVLSQASEVANSASAQELTGTTAPKTETVQTGGNDVLAQAANVADNAGAQALTGSEAPVAENTPSEPAITADKVASEEPIPPTPTATIGESPTLPEPEIPSGTEPTAPENVSSMSGVTPQEQAPEQIASAQQGSNSIGLVGESQPAMGQPVDATAGVSNQTVGETGGGSMGPSQASNETDETGQSGNTGTGGSGTPLTNAA